jgi:cytochrome P450
MTATAEIAPAANRVGRVSGVQVAFDTFRHGLRTDGPLVSGAEGTDIASFTFNRRTAYLLTHPDLVDHVLFDAVDHYHKSIEYELLRAAVGLSLFTDEDESWRRHRMLLNPVLAKRHLESLFELMVEPVEAFLGRLDDGSDRVSLQMSQAMTELTLDVVGSALFGRGMADLARRIGPRVTYGLRSAERATRLMLVFNPPRVLARALVLLVRHAPVLPPRVSGVQEVLKVVDETVWGVINERRAHPGRDDDLLGLLLSVRDEDGKPLPPRRVRDEACTFMLAGHETTANALSWMWYLLALNHEARERMLAEVDEVLGQRRPTFADVERLEWTTACFMEAMRLFSPAWIIPRVCVKDDVIAGHRIRKGSAVLIPIHRLHHDARFWPQPEVFDPTRFLADNARHHHRCSYLPFGAGRRVCAGKSFAMIEGAIVTAMMSQRFTYELIPGAPIVPEATLTLRPRRGIPMIARRRGVARAREAAAA